MLSCFPLLVIMLTTVAATPCLFNSMCTCKTDEALRMHIACVAVPLYTIPGNWKYTYLMQNFSKNDYKLLPTRYNFYQESR